MSLIPSQFPPIGLFDTVATAAHLSTVMELIAWTNDRLVADPIDRLPQREWVYGVPKAGIVMAAFGGMRFNGPEFGTEGLVRRRLYPDRSCRCRGRSPPAARDGRLQRSYDDPDCRAYTATLLGIISTSGASRVRVRMFTRASAMSFGMQILEAD
jgi:hypothetical protein